VNCIGGWLTDATPSSRPSVLDPGWQPQLRLFNNVTNTTTFKIVEVNIGHTLKPLYKVSETMWQLLTMSTLDEWSLSVRQFAFGFGWKGMLIAMIIMCVLFVTAISICNMVVAIMCNTAFAIIQKDTRRKSANVLEVKQQALGQFAPCSRFTMTDLFLKATDTLEWMS
jgi:hypothetical protein